MISPEYSTVLITLQYGRSGGSLWSLLWHCVTFYIQETGTETGTVGTVTFWLVEPEPEPEP